MRYIEVSHMCIFPYDGTNRIRFTGQDSDSPISAGGSGTPKSDLFCDL